MRRLCAAALAGLLALAAAGARAAEDPAAALPGAGALAPLQREGEVERHTPDTLWERINGAAELFKGYGLASSAHARYRQPEDPERRVELSVFLVADPLGAFGLFAAFRPAGCAPVQPLGNGGCLDDLQGIFWHGRHFVLADAAGPDATRGADLRRALEAVAALLGPAPARPGALRAFARVADTRAIRWQPQHLLGRDELPPGLEGAVGAITVFVSTGALAAESVLEPYAGLLEGAVRGEFRGRRFVSGRDPALGVVTLLAGEGRVAGARAGSEDPGILELVAGLAALDEAAAADGAW